MTEIAREQLEALVAYELTRAAGVSPDDVRCEGALQDHPGATQAGALASQGSWLPLVVRTIANQGDQPQIAVTVGQTPVPEPRQRSH